MSPGDGGPHRAGPVARLLGSLANALLDLGLPTIRLWLQGRLGPGAEVAHVKSDGSLIVLEGVRVPIGARGVLTLERATAAIAPLRRAGAPAVRLHSFEGALLLGTSGAEPLRADVSFEAAPEPSDGAWVSGQLEIARVAWPSPTGRAAIPALRARARLSVSSGGWRVDDGLIEGDGVVHARLSAAGSFEPDEEPSGSAPPLVRGVASAALTVERASLGLAVDAAAAIAGRELRVPRGVPRDGALSGEVSWSASDGASLDLGFASRAVHAGARAAFGPAGGGLRGRIDADVDLAALLLDLGAPAAALPRQEDVARVELALSGALEHVEVKGTIAARELGFRFGRPRFAPPVLVRDLICDVFFEGGQLALRGAVRARDSDARFDVDVELGALSSARGHVRADHLDASFLRELVATFGASVKIPDDAIGAADLALASHGGAPSLTGALTLTTSGSRMELTIADDAYRVNGTLAASDLVGAGIVRGAVLPVEGAARVSLELARAADARIEGRARADRIVLAVRGRDVRYVVEDASAVFGIDREALDCRDLRFRAHGGRFVARGAVPLSGAEAPPRALLELDLHEGGAELAEALLALTRGAFFIERDGERPPGEVWLPRDLGARGTLRIRAGAPLAADVSLVTPTGSSVALKIQYQRAAGFAGTTLAGALALDDVVRSGALGGAAPYTPRGIVELDAVVSRDRDRGAAILASLRSERLVLQALDAELVARDAAGAVRFDGEHLAWNHVELTLSDGVVTTSGVHAPGGATLAAVTIEGVAVHDLPPFGGRTPGELVRGRLGASLLGRWHAGGLRAWGALALEGAALPVIALVRPALASYGLRPPSEDASSAVTAKLLATEADVSLRDVKLALRGATVRGEVSVSRGRAVDAYAEVTLEEDYLRTSKLLTLPRVLAERLRVPVRIEGPLDGPRVHADLGRTLGRFLTDNRVRTLFTSAVGEALLGRRPGGEAAPESDPGAFEDPDVKAALRDALAAYAADWERILRFAGG